MINTIPNRTTALRFGKHSPRLDYRTFRFPRYSKGMPAPPDSLDNITRAMKAVSITDISKLFPMDNNDVEGDCTIAGVAHAVSLFQALIGKKKVMATSSVHKLYRHLSGGEDTGLVMLDVLNHWRKHTVDGDKILAFAKLDPHNHLHVKQAIQAFGGIYVGFQCQQAVLDDFYTGTTWTPGTLTPDGHAVFVGAYDADTVTALTWGNKQKGTWDWFDECCDEVYVVLPPEAKKAGFAPGFDFKTLQADIATITL